MPRPRGLATLAALALTSCFHHAAPPPPPVMGPLAGFAPRDFDRGVACRDWRAATADADAREHDAFPELDPARSCFVAVRHGDGPPRPDPIPPGCGYPRGETSRAAVDRAVDRYQAIAAGDRTAPLPVDLACELREDQRRAAAAHNARALLALRSRSAARVHPYAAASTFGFGNGQQRASALVSYLPGDVCPALDARGMRLFGVNVVRAARAAEAWFAGVAPVITVSGGAVHSPLVEAFLLEWLLACRFGVPHDAVLLDPCADHTHTNIRHTGALLRSIGGRTAYLVTDDGLQSAYLEEWTSFDLIGGSIDQRSLRDFGHLLGSFRRASVGMRAGFWYTPYRFWAEPEEGMGSFTCVP